MAKKSKSAKVTPTAAQAPQAKAAVPMPQARPMPATGTLLAAQPKPTAVSFGNLGLEWRTKPDGSAELVLAYDGPLAARDALVARAGTKRQGSEPWAEERELPLKRQGSRWVGAIPVRPGAPVEGVEFVFRAGDEWDNGGRAPLGYYEWQPAQGSVEVR